MKQVTMYGSEAYLCAASFVRATLQWVSIPGKHEHKQHNANLYVHVHAHISVNCARLLSAPITTLREA